MITAFKIYENFSKEKYLKDKKEGEKLLAQTLGDKHIIDIVENGDFEGLKYLLDTGYNISECDIDQNLLVIALNNNQDKMFDYLLIHYAPIDTIMLSYIVGEHNYDGSNIVTPKMVEILKKLTKKGFDFSGDGGDHNQIYYYLSEYGFNRGVEQERIIVKGVEPFIDWLLTNYPDNYNLTKTHTGKSMLTDKLKKKFEYLENSKKYNI